MQRESSNCRLVIDGHHNDENDLVRKIVDGDKKAFNVLTGRYHGKLLRSIMYMIQNQHEAEDVVQESFLKAYSAISQFRCESSFYTWLYRIGINTAKNFLAQKSLLSQSETDADESLSAGGDYRLSLPDMETPEMLLESKQLLLMLNEAFDELSAELKTALTLRDIKGYSYCDIAVALNCPVGTIRSRIFRARAAIFERLKPKDDCR